MKNIKLIVAALFFVTIVVAQTKGTLAGVVTDKNSNNAPLPFANIYVKEVKGSTTSNEVGKYSISLNPGNYLIQFSSVGYEGFEKVVTIKSGETTNLNCSLGSGNYTLKDVVIKSTANREKETAILLDQKNAVVFKQSIGAQEMSRKGISDVEEGLTKITGITKVDGRGLFVRGLEERYSNLLINELQAPSNSPFTKIIPLDLFPTDIVGVLNVYKTFNPNISGDFAGATVNIETVQAKSITKINIGTGFVTANNFSDFLIHSDANNPTGFFGLNGNNRQLSAVFRNVPSGKKLTPEEYSNAYQDNSWNVVQKSSPLNNSIGFLHSEKFSLNNGSKINYVLSLNTDNKSVIRKGVDRTFILGAGDYDNNFQRKIYSYQTNSSALAAINFKAKRFDFGVNTFYLRSTDSKIQDQLGYTANQSTNPNILIRTNQFDQSDYINSQLLGNVKVSADGVHTIKFGGSFVNTSYKQPDRKFIIGEKVSDTEINTSYGGNHLNRQDLNINGNYYFSGLLEYNFKTKVLQNGKSDLFTLGYNVFQNDLSSKYRIFATIRTINKNYTASLNNIDQYITEDINNGIIALREESNSDYKVKLNQIVNAGYANYLYHMGNKLEVNAGVRLENSNLLISYRNLGQVINSPFIKIKQDGLVILPVLNAKYEITEKSNFRLNGSKTITRPVTMELLPLQYVSPDGKSVLGNPNLKNSDNYNLDLKFEVFPKSTELFVVGLFSKQIINPIERVFIAGAGGSGQTTNYKNSKEALLFGAELEMLFGLERLSPVLSDFSFGLNTTVMKTEVSVDYGQNSLENSPKRALQGASEWMINSDLKYDFRFSEIMKNSISLVYGVSGSRIFAVGSAGMDHIYEKPFQKLDFIWSSKLSKAIDLKFAIDNILNPMFKMQLGDQNKFKINEDSLILENYRRGTGFALNLAYTF
jgi:outer membrane receptor protein involved in Fe transport